MTLPTEYVIALREQFDRILAQDFGDTSTAAIFRTIEAHCPTFILDEADTFLRENKEAGGILNAGHTRRTASVVRLVGGDHEPKKFSVWCAQIIAGIGEQSDTLTDRSIRIWIVPK